MARYVQSIEGFIKSLTQKELMGENTDTDFKVFFRGQANKDWGWTPSLFRNTRYLQNEYEIFNEIYSKYVQEFKNDKTTFDKLVRMQHFGLPTRLLDITTNPLVSLYFACQDNDIAGKVTVFYVPTQDVKYGDSDSVACIANLARLKHSLRETIKQYSNTEKFNQQDAVMELNHKILEEKPHFRPSIKHNDLNKIHCVIPRMNNSRIISQSGAFLLFGGYGKIDPNWGDIRYEEISISKEYKINIISALEKLNINQGSLFPDIEKMSEYISRKYK